MSSFKLDRRTFLGVSLASTAPVFLTRTLDCFAEESAEQDDVLVVIQLSGGNDGLSTVVPFKHDDYLKARRTTRVANTIQFDEHRGFHPNLDKLAPLYKEGKMAIVEGCSYPNPNRSHFKSMDIWHTADKRGRGIDTGWLGRAIDAKCPKEEDPNLVINVGGSVPYALRGQIHKPVSFSEINNYTWRGRAGDRKPFDELNQPQEGMSDLDWLHRTAANARMSSSVLKRAAAKYQAKAEYPSNNRLAGQLRQVASLITGGVRTRVFYVSIGSFDTHVRQKQAHDNLMRQLGDAIAAFWEDIHKQGCGKRVSLMCFSEFGRRVTENASGGTDHGVAGPMFLFGDRVKGGLHGEHPSLTDLDQGDLKMKVDFRQVYASVLSDWMKVDATKVLGKAYDKLDLFNG